MKKITHTSKKRDVSQLAKAIVDRATSDNPDETPAIDPTKNPAAVSLGRLGGLKGGKARAEKLSPQRRKNIARKAAKARWDNRKPESTE
jgi:hypothetical protein